MAGLRLHGRHLGVTEQVTQSQDLDTFRTLPVPPHLEYKMGTQQPIPITVFTGFLGSGKTSIILSLLPQLPKDYKVVLLKNEFGDVEGAYHVAGSY